MTEPVAHPIDPNDNLLDALTKVTAMFPWPMPRERDEAVCTDMARGLDAVLHPLARGRGGVDVTIGEGLDALSKGDRVLRLGYSGIADYAREELGLNASTAEKMARFARKLRERPRLRAAVLAGEVCVRRAEAVMHVAVGDAEEYWVARARLDTVRALKAMAKNPIPSRKEDEQWDQLLELSRDAQAALDRATGVAGKILGANAPRQHRMEALFQEYAAAHAVPDEEDTADLMPSAPVEDCLEPGKELLEQQNRKWASLYQLGSIAAPWTDPDCAQRTRGAIPAGAAPVAVVRGMAAAHAGIGGDSLRPSDALRAPSDRGQGHESRLLWYIGRSALSPLVQQRRPFGREKLAPMTADCRRA